MSKVDITLNNMENVGSISFTQPGEALAALRTANGVRLLIPALITFRPPQASQNALMLEDVQATFFAFGEGGEKEIGTAHYPESLTTERRDQPIMFTWDWTFPAVAFYERLRNGAEPTFRLAVSGNIRFLFPHVQHHQICSMASTFRSQGQVRYSREAWTKTLRDLNIRESVIVELPFPANPPSGWEPIWQALLDARNSFDTGGSTGWKNCVVSVRHALEEWRKIELEDQGPGDFKSRTKDQRIDSLRWSLMQFAHFAPHSRADEWTRDDALLALSTLSALLANRKP